MTRKSQALSDKSNYWKMQDAKARLSELFRRVREVGPQHVTVHGRDEMVVITAEQFRELQAPSPSGASIVEAFAASPLKNIEIEPKRYEDPIRPVVL